MKTPLKIMAGLMVALALQPALCGDGPQRRIQIHGSWDEWNPDLFRVDAELDRSRSYTVRNDTENTIYVMLVEVESGGRTPRDYFPVLAGRTQLFGAPGHLSPEAETFSLDLVLMDYDGDKVRGVVLREDGPELVTD